MSIIKNTIKHYHWVLTRDRTQTPDLNPETTAGLVIDMQSGYTDSVKELDPLVSAQSNMLSFFRDLEIPAIAIEHAFLLEDTHLPLGTQIRWLKNYATVTKHHWNGFTEPDLESTLIDWGTKDLILMGLLSHCCVKSTAKGAYRRGFRIHTARQLIAGRDIEEWYSRHGTYFDDFRTLQEAIT